MPGLLMHHSAAPGSCMRHRNIVLRKDMVQAVIWGQMVREPSIMLPRSRVIHTCSVMAPAISGLSILLQELHARTQYLSLN